MHLTRSISVNVVQPFRRALRVAAAPSAFPAPIPVLMYHGISDEAEPGVSPYYRVNTSPAVFRQQMQFLAERGYRTITVSELAKVTAGPGANGTSIASSLPPGSMTTQPPLVAITFDDGFRNFYTEAFPALKAHGFTATMFLPTAFIDDSRRTFAPRGSTLCAARSTSAECLTWAEVQELHRAGIEFGSHTVNHPKLVELDWPELRFELCESKAAMEARLGCSVSSFCYPYAFPQANRSFVEQFTKLLAQTGYGCCTTTEVGRVQPGDSPFCLKRLPVNALDDLALLEAKLQGAYDWVALPQFAVKTLKGLVRARRRSPVSLDQTPDAARLDSSSAHPIGRG